MKTTTAIAIMLATAIAPTVIATSASLEEAFRHYLDNASLQVDQDLGVYQPYCLGHVPLRSLFEDFEEAVMRGDSVFTFTIKDRQYSFDLTWLREVPR